jgi:hypothetical protein
MGYRTLSLDLVLRALFLDDRAFDQLRDDDNPFVEGLFLIVIIALLTALLALIGEALAWAGAPSMAGVQQIILEMLRQTPWWADIAPNPQALSSFQQIWDGAWRVLPPLFGAPNPAGAAGNLLAWPIFGIVAWLGYGVLAHLFARLFHGTGTFTQTLGVTALAFTPWLFHGLELIPYLVLGGFVATWQLLLRYKAIRSVHQLPWGRAVWATILPFLLLAALALLFGGFAAALAAAIVGGR